MAGFEVAATTRDIVSGGTFVVEKRIQGAELAQSYGVMRILVLCLLMAMIMPLTEAQSKAACTLLTPGPMRQQLLLQKVRWNVLRKACTILAL
jgi:hypothetical protein